MRKTDISLFKPKKKNKGQYSLANPILSFSWSCHIIYLSGLHFINLLFSYFAENKELGITVLSKYECLLLIDVGGVKDRQIVVWENNEMAIIVIFFFSEVEVSCDFQQKTIKNKNPKIIAYISRLEEIIEQIPGV